MCTPKEAASLYKAALISTPPCRELLKEAIRAWEKSLNNYAVFGQMSVVTRGDLAGVVRKNMAVAHGKCINENNVLAGSSAHIALAMYHFREMLTCINLALGSHSDAEWLSATFVKRDALVSECVTCLSKGGPLPHTLFSTLKDLFGKTETRAEILYEAASNLVTGLQKKVPSRNLMDETNYKDVLRVVMEVKRPLAEALDCCQSVGLRRHVEDMQEVVEVLYRRALCVQCRLAGDEMVKSALDDDEFLNMEKVCIARDHYKESSQHANVTGIVLNEEVHTMHSVANVFLNVLKVPSSAKEALTSLFQLSSQTSCHFDNLQWYKEARDWLQKLRGETPSEKFEKFKQTEDYKELQKERKEGPEGFLRFVYRKYPPSSTFLKGDPAEEVERLIAKLKAGGAKSCMTTCATHNHPDRYVKESEHHRMCREEITSIANAFATGANAED